MIQAVFGGLALGASLAALADAFRSRETPSGQDALGQFVFSAGPPSSAPSGGGGPMVLPPGPEGWILLVGSRAFARMEGDLV